MNLLVKRVKEARKTPPRRRRRDNPRREMTFLEHLDELRGRLIISAVAIVLTTVIGGIFLARPALDWLMRPFHRLNLPRQSETILKLQIGADGVIRALNPQDLTHAHLLRDRLIIYGHGKVTDRFTWIPDAPPAPTTGAAALNHQPAATSKPVEYAALTVGPKRATFIATQPMAPFVLLIKVALILGAVFAMPIWLHQVWLFVAPALTKAERKVVRPVLRAGIVLFPMGVLFAYGMLYFVMPVMLGYAESIGNVQMMPDVMKYLSFALNIMIAFGLVFEMPLVIVLMVRMGLVSTETLRRSRSYIVVILFVVAAVMTPPDPFSLMAMPIPMLLLFEGSLWFASGIERRIAAEEAREAAREAEAEAAREKAAREAEEAAAAAEKAAPQDAPQETA